MNLSIHLMTSIILGTTLFPVFGWKAFFVIIGGFLIDTDHYILHLFKKRNFNLKEAYFYFRDGENCKEILKNNILMFHTMEALIVPTILSIYSELFLMVTIGMILHLILDWIEDLKNYESVKSPSLILWLFHKFYKQNKSTF